jgi:hypothetical protein
MNALQPKHTKSKYFTLTSRAAYALDLTVTLFQYTSGDFIRKMYSYSVTMSVQLISWLCW